MCDNYGVFTNNEVSNSLKELKRETAAGIDKIRTQNLKSIPISHITAIMNYWWGRKIPDSAKQCRHYLTTEEK